MNRIILIFISFCLSFIFSFTFVEPRYSNDSGVALSPTSNLVSAKRMNVDKVINNKKFRSPNGKGVLVGVTDTWTVAPDISELIGRVTLLHDTTGIDTTGYGYKEYGHGTGVAGLIAASGMSISSARGTAPAAEILSLVKDYDPIAEIAHAAKTYGLKISCNAWSLNSGDVFLPPRRLINSASVFPGGQNSTFGPYIDFNHEMDSMIRKSDVLYIWSAGNDGGSTVLFPFPDRMGILPVIDDWHRTYLGFDTIDIESTSKNALVIGATHKDDVICGFSSKGPVFNGRIAPHLVAPGYELTTLGPEGGYGVSSGTSGSAPLVAGVAALLIQQYKAIHGLEPSSALLKALLINTARDLGPKGPDYDYGFGIVDAELAARTISGQEKVKEEKTVRSRFEEDSLKNKEQHVHTFNVPRNRQELRVTLVWHDLPGAKLINDLDLWVRYGKGKKIKPLTPNPNNPLEAAKNKRNTIDNTEHVFVENPQAGEWSIFIKGKKIPKGKQEYALVIAASKGNNIPIKKTEGDFTIDRSFASKGDVNQSETNFRIGDPLYFHALLNISENALYPDGYYGAVTGRFEIRDQTGDLKMAFTTSWDRCAPTQLGQPFNFYWRTPAIPEGDVSGNYRIRTIITMHNGVTKTAPIEYEVTIQ